MPGENYTCRKCGVKHHFTVLDDSTLRYHMKDIDFEIISLTYKFLELDENEDYICDSCMSSILNETRESWAKPR